MRVRGFKEKSVHEGVLYTKDRKYDHVCGTVASLRIVSYLINFCIPYSLFLLQLQPESSLLIEGKKTKSKQRVRHQIRDSPVYHLRGLYTSETLLFIFSLFEC